MEILIREWMTQPFKQNFKEKNIKKNNCFSYLISL